MQVCFLRDAAEAICPFLTHIVNLSIIQAKFPTEHVQRVPYVHYAHGEWALPKIKKKKICGRLTQINTFFRIARNCGLGLDKHAVLVVFHPILREGFSSALLVSHRYKNDVKNILGSELPNIDV